MTTTEAGMDVGTQRQKKGLFSPHLWATIW
jgi:hypothetical protein